MYDKIYIYSVDLGARNRVDISGWKGAYKQYGYLSYGGSTI